MKNVVFYHRIYNMSNTYNHKVIPRRVATKYNSLVIVTSKLQEKAASISFIEKDLHQNLHQIYKIYRSYTTIRSC